MPWRGPRVPGEVPTLGPQVIEWFADNLIVPDGPAAGQPLVLYPEQEMFVLRFYALDRHARGPAIDGLTINNARRVRRAVLSRPKGWGKSPLMAAMCMAEALAPVVFDGWDHEGEPVAVPWTELGFKAKVQVVAVSEDQTANTWDPLLEMARYGPVAERYPIEALETFVNIPRGRIEFTTSAARSREGFRPVFAAMDQTESWTPNVGGPKLAATIRRNIAKVNGASIETPNAFIPGEESVAEKSWEAWQAQQAGKTRGESHGILFDHREAPGDTDPSDRDSLMAGLAVAYKDSADINGGHVNLDRIREDYWDPSTDPQDARHFYLNQITHTTDSWLTQPDWAARARPMEIIGDGDLVTLGFDGSRRRSRGVTDATALVGVRLSDAHVFELRVWEQPDGPAGEDWQVPASEVDAEVRTAFNRLRVVGFYADPAKWESYVAQWEADFGAKLDVKASIPHPVEWWMTGGRASKTVMALESFHDAVIDGGLTHDGSSVLTRHILNARRRTSRAGIQIAKESPDSARKIDAAVAAVLAFQAYLDAVAAGVMDKVTKAPSRVIRRY